MSGFALHFFAEILSESKINKYLLGFEALIQISTEEPVPSREAKLPLCQVFVQIILMMRRNLGKIPRMDVDVA